jgi:hypothetical protein
MQLATIVDAFIKSLGERSILGTIGAPVRAGLLILRAAERDWSGFVGYGDASVTRPGRQVAAAAATIVVAAAWCASDQAATIA